MSKEYFSGATLVYRSTVINGAGGGDTSVTFLPRTGNEFALVQGSVSHDDATASTINALIRDEDGNTQIGMIDALASVTQNSVNYFPSGIGTIPATGGNQSGVPHPLMVSGTMDVFVNAVAIDASEGSTHTLIARLRGGIPTITELGNSTPTITITTERTY